MRKKKTLLLDAKTVSRLIDIKKAIRAVKRAFYYYGVGKARMPSKVYLDLPEFSGDFRAMPAFIPGMNICALKWVNAHPNNKKYGFPSVMAVVILNDPKTAFPLAIMDGTVLTNIRTGAAGALAAQVLARKDSRILGLVGCGAQARTQLAALATSFSFDEIRVWGHKKVLVKRFIADMKSRYPNLVPAMTVRQSVEGCDIVVTTTPVRKPVVKYQWIKKGAHINAIGADARGKQELESRIIKQAKVVIDDWAQASHSGEINVPLAKRIITRRKIYGELGEIVARKKKGRVTNDEITVFDSTGLAIQDAAVASLLYEDAKNKKVGRWIQLL